MSVLGCFFILAARFVVKYFLQRELLFLCSFIIRYPLCLYSLRSTSKTDEHLMEKVRYLFFFAYFLIFTFPLSSGLISTGVGVFTYHLLSSPLSLIALGVGCIFCLLAAKTFFHSFHYTQEYVHDDDEKKKKEKKRKERKERKKETAFSLPPLSSGCGTVRGS